VAGLALTGCTPTDAPPTAATGPATATASTAAPVPTSDAPSPTPVYKPATASGPAQNVPVPVLPAKAKEFSKAGLEAFATYWYSTLGYAFETGDSAPMMAISDPACQTCAAMKKAVQNEHAGGKWIVGGRMVVQSVTGNIAPAPDGSYQTITMVRQENVKYYNADTSLSEDMGVTTSIADIVVTHYVNGHWIAKTVEHLQGSKGN